MQNSNMNENKGSIHKINNNQIINNNTNININKDNNQNAKINNINNNYDIFKTKYREINS